MPDADQRDPLQRMPLLPESLVQLGPRERRSAHHRYLDRDPAERSNLTILALKHLGKGMMLNLSEGSAPRSGREEDWKGAGKLPRSA